MSDTSNDGGQRGGQAADPASPEATAIETVELSDAPADTPTDPEAGTGDGGLDLTQESSGGQSTVPPKPDTTPYDPTEDREQARGKIAFYLLNLLTFIVIGSFGIIGIAFLVYWGQTGTTVDMDKLASAIEKLIELLFTPIVGLVGAATGFYFGEKSGKS